jgi:hypothetical protein
MAESHKRFLSFTFEREAWWMVLMAVLLPVLGLALIVVAALLRRWEPSVR